LDRPVGHDVWAVIATHMFTLPPKTIKALAETISGDNDHAPYLSGSKLVAFFNELGFDEEYGQWFPTRWVYAKEKIVALQGTERLRDCILETVNPERFMGTNFDYQDTIKFLNEYLQFNGYEIVSTSPTDVYIKEAGKASVDFNRPMKATTPNLETFIDEQMKKCDRKLYEGDYDGAITNARSLAESVLHDLECRLSECKPKKDGDLPKMFKRVRSLMNMKEKDYEGHTSILQLIGGMNSIVNGIATMSNDMGDRHARGRKPLKHHATLCVNASKTLCDFLLSSYVHQTAKGTLVEP